MSLESETQQTIGFLTFPEPSAHETAHETIQSWASRAVSSEVERLLYTQDVGGSIPSPPTSRRTVSNIPTIAKEEPRRRCSRTNVGVRSFQQLQVSTNHTRHLSRLSMTRSCNCTTPWPRRQVWPKSPGGTRGSNADPDAPESLARLRGHMRVDLSNPRVAHHAGVIIPVHEATPGA
jgi:hypothetical protein